MSTFSTCTSTTRPGSPTDGDVLFETDTKNVIIWDGTNWRGYENDGFPVNSTHSLAFDATDDYADISNASSLLNSTTSYTISFWYKTTATSDAGRMVAGGTASSNRINVSIGGTSLFFSINGTSISATQPSVNAWHHVIAQRDGTNGAIYVNGNTTAFASTTSFPSGSTSTQASNLSVGRIPFGSAGYFNGFIDEVALFTRPLTESERTAIYNNHIYKNPSALWLFNNNTDDFNGLYNATLQNGLGYSSTEKRP